MGTWSATLYGNDAAADIRGDVKELLRAPLDETAIIAALTETYPSLTDTSDEECCDLWLAVADQLHAYGVAAPAVSATATTIIDTGLDLDTKRSLGMDETEGTKATGSPRSNEGERRRTKAVRYGLIGQVEAAAVD